MPPSRDELVATLIQATRRSATTAVLFHGAIAERFSLTATDTRTLELLDRLGPRSAGDIATHTGLAATSVTSLIDRLEARGLVRRTSDPADRRRVVVERVPDGAAQMNAPYAAIARATMKVIAEYAEHDLQVIADYLNRGAEAAEAAIAQLHVEGNAKTLHPSGDKKQTAAQARSGSRVARRSRSPK
jgi:DNA-binding MarR family transcriptional regulator